MVCVMSGTDSTGGETRGGANGGTEQLLCRYPENVKLEEFILIDRALEVAVTLGAPRTCTFEHRALRPGDLGTGPRVGHFGFFRKGTTVLWDETADWVLRQARRS